MAEQPQQWLTPEELAEELNVPMKTLYVWNHKRKGPAFTRVGKHVRYSRTAVDEWLANHTKQPIAS